MPKELMPLPNTQLQYGFSSDQFELAVKQNSWYLLKLKTSIDPSSFFSSICYAVFKITTTGIYISDMRSSVQHGGSALHEYIFRLSCRYPQLKGQVYLDAAWASHYFHHVCGFRGYNYHDTVNLLTDDPNFIANLKFELGNFMRAKPSEKKEQMHKILKLVLEHPNKLTLIITGYKRFNCQDKYRIANIDFIEKLNSLDQLFQALFPTENQILQQDLDMRKGKERVTEDLGKKFMYIPHCIIEQKKKVLGISEPMQEAGDLALSSIDNMNASRRYDWLSEVYASSISQYSDQEIEQMIQQIKLRLLDAAPQPQKSECENIPK